MKIPVGKTSAFPLEKCLKYLLVHHSFYLPQSNFHPCGIATFSLITENKLINCKQHRNAPSDVKLFGGRLVVEIPFLNRVWNYWLSGTPKNTVGKPTFWQGFLAGKHVKIKVFESHILGFYLENLKDFRRAFFMMVFWIVPKCFYRNFAPWYYKEKKLLKGGAQYLPTKGNKTPCTTAEPSLIQYWKIRVIILNVLFPWYDDEYSETFMMIHVNILPFTGKFLRLNHGR